MSVTYSDPVVTGTVRIVPPVTVEDVEATFTAAVFRHALLADTGFYASDIKYEQVQVVWDAPSPPPAPPSPPPTPPPSPPPSPPRPRRLRRLRRPALRPRHRHRRRRQRRPRHPAYHHRRPRRRARQAHRPLHLLTAASSLPPSPPPLTAAAEPASTAAAALAAAPVSATPRPRRCLLCSALRGRGDLLVRRQGPLDRWLVRAHAVSLRVGRATPCPTRPWSAPSRP